MERKSKKEQFIIKACCAIAAFILWLYIFNIENPIKERNITVPVKVINQSMLSESKLAPVIDGEVSISITISGNVTDIYSIKPEQFDLQADLSALALKKGENKIPVTVKTSPAGTKVVNSDSLWVTINIDEMVKKTVPVKVIFEGKTKEGFYAINPELNNKEAIVSGPAKNINSVKYAVARCDINGAYKDVSFNTQLQAESEDGTKFQYVLVNPKVINITVFVKKVKTVGINVKLSESLNNSTGIKSVLPAESTIQIAGDDEYINSISSLDTEPIDIKSLKGATSVEAKLVIPKGITIVNNISEIKLNVTYNNLIQKEFSILVKGKNLPSGLTTDLNSSISITVSGTESLINSLKGENIDCFVDLNNLGEGTYNLQVNTKLPEGISRISLSPANISVTLKK